MLRLPGLKTASFTSLADQDGPEGRVLLRASLVLAENGESVKLTPEEHRHVQSLFDAALAAALQHLGSHP